MLRRILWIVPTLFFVSILVFQFLSWTLPEPDQGSSRRTTAVFFNPEPDNVRDRSLSIMKRVARGERDEDAVRELAELGGAALPHVLPRLDELDPAGRARVSIALRPVARRMGLGTREDFGSGEATTLFWTRFWQDRALDYRPVVVRRLAKRASEKQLTLRRDDIIQLDTYALPELMRALGRVWSADDVPRTQRLTALLSHVTNKPEWMVDEDASVSEASRVVQQWNNWWTDNRDRFTTLDGLSRATAMITQTSYGKWVRGLGFGLGTSHNGSTVLEGLKAGAPVTLLLVLAGLFGAYPAGATLGALSAQLGAAARRILSLLALALLATPIALWAPWSNPQTASPLAKTVLATAFMLSWGCAWTLLHQTASTRAKLHEFTAQRARRPPGTRALLRGTGGTSLALFTSDLPLLFMAASVLEYGLGLVGLGGSTVNALRTGDVAWLMAVSLLGAMVVGVTQILGDEVARTLEPSGALAATRLRAHGG